MAKLKQASVADTRISTRARAIDMDALSGKVVDANQVRIERRCKRRPTSVIAEDAQDNFESMRANRMRLSSFAYEAAQCKLARGHPRLNMDEPMIASRENGAQPDRCDASDAEALPVPMRREMVVKQSY